MKKLLKTILFFFTVFVNVSFPSSCVSVLESRALVFVPPMLSSKLKDIKNNEIVWLDFSLRSLRNFLQNHSFLQFDEKGKPLNKNIKPFPTKSWNMSKVSDYGVGDCDKKIIQNLEKKFGPKSKYKCDIIRYAYDWRESCSKTSEDLVNLVKKYNEVYFVSCSEGGLLVCDALAKIAKNNNLASRVKCSVFVAVPFRGTLEPLYVFYNGIRLGGLFGTFANFLGVKNITKKLSRNLPAMYELLPHEDSYVTKKIESSNWYKKKNGELKGFLKNANSFHRKLYNKSKHIVEYYNSYFICGTGIDTMASLQGKEKLEISKTADGDGTVINVNSYPRSINKDRIINVKNVKHTQMSISDSVINSINKILENNIVFCKSNT